MHTLYKNVPKQEQLSAIEVGYNEMQSYIYELEMVMDFDEMLDCKTSRSKQARDFSKYHRMNDCEFNCECDKCVKREQDHIYHIAMCDEINAMELEAYWSIDTQDAWFQFAQDWYTVTDKPCPF